MLSDQDLARSSIVKTFHSLGFPDVSIGKSLADWSRISEKKTVDWLIIYLPGCMDRLDRAWIESFYEKSRHTSVRFSIVVTEQERFHLPILFAAGALSWLPAEIVRDSKALSSWITHFFGSILMSVQDNRHEAYVAATSLRSYLREAMIWDDLIELDKTMVDAFPSQPDNLLTLAESYFCEGDYNKGRACVEQLRQVAPESYEEQIQQLQERFPNSLLKKEESFVERFSVKNIACVERDVRERQLIDTVLRRLGASEIRFFDSFRSAWGTLSQSSGPDMLIFEWTKRQDDLSSIQFAQRVRDRFPSLPIIGLVSQILPQEGQLLNDLGTVQIIHKPLREEPTLMSLAFAIQQSKSPTERKTIEQKIIQCLQSGEQSLAFSLRKQFIAKKSIAQSRKLYVEAMFYFYLHNYVKARDLLVKAIKVAKEESGPEMEGVKTSIDKTVLLSKCLFKLGDKEVAVRLLESTRQRSPYNIGILTALMEMNYEVGRIKEAKEAMADAESIDAGNIRLLQASAHLSLLVGDTEKATACMEKVENLQDLVRRLNNQAILLIQSDQYSKGVDLYQSALNSLPTHETGLIATVNYNMALAHFRNDQFDKGYASLQSALEHTHSKIYTKAQNLQRRIEASQAAGQPLQFPKVAAMGRGHEREHPSEGFLQEALSCHYQPHIALYGLFRAANRTKAEVA